MSAANSSANPPAVQPVTAAKFWDDMTVELNDQRVKAKIPALPEIAEDYQTVRGGGIETLAYCILQIKKGKDKTVIVRAIASATAWLLNTTANLTGSSMRTEVLTGLEPVAQDGIPDNTVLHTNFEDEEEVTVGEILSLMAVDPDELGSYIGVLYLAGNKRVSQQNRTAFNEKRQSAATASILGKAKIFVPDSEYLTDAALNAVYAAFLSCSPLRAQMTAQVVNVIHRPWMGPTLAFMNMFLLLENQGMSALRIIKEAVLHYPWIRTEFPELAPEFEAVNQAQDIIRRAPANVRSFLKAIHGSSFVPVNYSDIKKLTGVCKEILKRTTPSYQNYGGGIITQRELEVIQRMLGDKEVIVESAAAE